MDSPSSSAVRRVAIKTPSDASLLHAMRVARELGVEVVLKPHVDVLDGSFRADVQPADRAAWFASYEAMISFYADLAAQGGARDEQAWRSIIAAVRGRFGGELTYAANWVDGAEQVDFWDVLDYIGVDAYMPLSSTPDPSADELAAAWHDRGYVRRLADLHVRHGKPVIFTELGYQSRFGTTMTPWSGATGAIDQGAQARAYEAAFRAFWHEPWFAGIYWWDWRADVNASDPGGHPIAGKAAAGVMHSWHMRPRDPAPPPAPSPAPAVAPAPPLQPARTPHRRPPSRRRRRASTCAWRGAAASTGGSIRTAERAQAA